MRHIQSALKVSEITRAIKAADSMGPGYEVRIELDGAIVIVPPHGPKPDIISPIGKRNAIAPTQAVSAAKAKVGRSREAEGGRTEFDFLGFWSSSPEERGRLLEHVPLTTRERVALQALLPAGVGNFVGLKQFSKLRCFGPTTIEYLLARGFIDVPQGTRHDRAPLEAAISLAGAEAVIPTCETE